MQRSLFALLLIGLSALTTGKAAAKNIDLSTIPPRDSVQLTIYNGADLTLVRETRRVSLKEGNNRLQFSWANTLIDPTSVQLQFLRRPDRFALLDTTFPHEKPKMLYWNVKSEAAEEALVQISYFTSGISWKADYVAIAKAQQQHMDLAGHVTVTNQSGEDYDNARVRLVVGKINLVEKIKELAQQGMGEQEPPEAMDAQEKRQHRHRAMRQMLQAAEAGMGADAAAPQQPKDIVKEGLSEYFIFTVEGRETIPDTWSKRLKSFDAKNVPIDVQYRYRQREYGNKLVRLFLLENSKEAELGQAPLPNGTVRLFQQRPGEGLRYLTEQSIDYIPIGEDIELNLGPNKEVVFQRKSMRHFRDQIWAQVEGFNVKQRLDKPGVDIDKNMRVVGWDEHEIVHQHIRNYTDRAIEVQIRRRFSGDVTFQSQLNPSRHDYQTAQFTTTVKPGQRKALRYEVITRKGDNAEQNRVRFKAGEPAPVPWAQAP
jgi:hypothetical protein